MSQVQTARARGGIGVKIAIGCAVLPVVSCCLLMGVGWLGGPSEEELAQRRAADIAERRRRDAERVHLAEQVARQEREAEHAFAAMSGDEHVAALRAAVAAPAIASLDDAYRHLRAIPQHHGDRPAARVAWTTATLDLAQQKLEDGDAETAASLIGRVQALSEVPRSLRRRVTRLESAIEAARTRRVAEAARRAERVARCGDRPEVDGVLAANIHLQQTLHDPGSLEGMQCRDPRLTRDCWNVRCTYRARNALGAMVRADTTFLIRAGRVVGTR